MLGDNSAGSRGQPAHIIALRDPEGDTIQPEDRRPLPFSPRQTCGASCHDVATISRGWHFNAALAGVPPGRKGQPWFLVDRETATQLPLSYRAWPGTYKPSQLGLSDRGMALRFGGRMAGGLPQGLPQDAAGSADRARWAVSGDLEVNCLACHDASPAYDQAEYARQVALENFRYAPTAASSLAAVTGSAKEMPNFFDYLLPSSVEDSLQSKIPRVDYASHRFLPNGKVAFDIVRDVKVVRCYYCHTNIDVEQTGAARWKANEDVHLARGITCVQCHRNNLDHMITRGYEGDPATAADPFAASLSCRGCHMGEDADPNSPGRMGAPNPDHAGIPPVHFEKLTCTACHSGPWPSDDTRRLKNGLSHGLGEFNVNKSPDVLPHIEYPVFAPQQDGKIGPHRMIWPAFWGRLRAGSVAPLSPDEVRKTLQKGKLQKDLAPDGSWPRVDAEWVGQVLRLLDEEAATAGPAVYIAGGRLHRRDSAGRLVAEDHPQAQPYLWPLAHDVRPASQSLGARGCQDCHSPGAPFFQGSVAVDSPLASERAVPWKMYRFEKNLDIAYNTRLARLWVFRSWLKAGGMLAAALLLLLLSAYALPALERVSAGAAGNWRVREADEGPQPALRLFRWSRVAVNVAGVISFAAIAVTGFYSYFMKGAAMTGYRLMVHVAAAPVFMVAAVAVALFWAHRNRFTAASGANRVVLLRKFFFWAAAALLAPTVVSILLAMYPLAGPGDQQELFLVHRCCALAFTAAASLFGLFALLAWRKGNAR
jgi:mono/diheme cytochrome c family protein